MDARYVAALDADRAYTEVIARLTGRTRWTITAEQSQLPEIAAAYHAKVNADRVWLYALRESR